MFNPTPLSFETCQRIHVYAISTVGKSSSIDDIPDTIDVDAFNEHRRLFGNDVCIFPDDHIAFVFSNVTWLVYREIESLYVSWERRSMKTVWLLLNYERRANGLPPIDYEAVWAICSYLNRMRSTQYDQAIINDAGSWCLGIAHMSVSLRETEELVISYVFDESRSRVVGFSVGTNDTVDQVTALAIYDAIVSFRKPTLTTDARRGLIWYFPDHIMSSHMLPTRVIKSLQGLGIELGIIEDCQIEMLKKLQENWARDLQLSGTSIEQFTIIVDNHLRLMHRHGPHTVRDGIDEEYGGLIGYNRHPASQLPELRELLPVAQTKIVDGSIFYRGKPYYNKYLKYIPDGDVDVRIDPSQEKLWVYRCGEILFEADSAG